MFDYIKDIYETTEKVIIINTKEKENEELTKVRISNCGEITVKFNEYDNKIVIFEVKRNEKNERIY